MMNETRKNHVGGGGEGHLSSHENHLTLKDSSQTILAVLLAMMCVACAGIVMMDGGVDAVSDPTDSFDVDLSDYGSDEFTYRFGLLEMGLEPSDGFIFDLTTLVYEANIADNGHGLALITLPYGISFEVYALIGTSESIQGLQDASGNADNSVGGVSFESIGGSYNGRVHGSITESFIIEYSYSDYYGERQHSYFFVYCQPPIDFTSPSIVRGISGDPITYTATTNVVSTFSEFGGTAASWLDIDPTTGKVTGTLPTIDSVTTYTYEIQAASVDDQSKTATLPLTITVTPALEFLSDPAEGAMALIGSQTQSEYHPMQARE